MEFFLHHIDFCEEINFHCSLRENNKAIKAIPVYFRTMIRQIMVHSNIVSELRQLCTEGIDSRSEPFTNTFIRNVLRTILLQSSEKRYVVQNYSDEKTCNFFFKNYPILPKTKEVTYKFLNDVCPSNHFLRVKFNWNNNSWFPWERDCNCKACFLYNVNTPSFYLRQSLNPRPSRPWIALAPSGSEYSID